jgi:long-chain acyl-CoA synthetase
VSDRSAPETLFERFVRRGEQDADRTARWIKSQGVYGAVRWRELAGAVDRAAVVLQQLGVRPGDRVIQLSENRYEWIVLDLALQLAQVVHVPVHAPLAGPQVAQQVHDSGARVVFASSDAQARKLERAAAGGGLPPPNSKTPPTPLRYPGRRKLRERSQRAGNAVRDVCATR